MQCHPAFSLQYLKNCQKGDLGGPLGQWTPRTIANMDQTPLPFTFCDGPTYADTGECSVWVCGAASGLEKGRCTAQVTIFADGEPRVKPLLIFRGTGKRIALEEKVRYNRRVSVVFQPKAWCDERVMRHWVRTCRKPACQGPMHLIRDVHKAIQSRHCCRSVSLTQLTYQVAAPVHSMYPSTSLSKMQ